MNVLFVETFYGGSHRNFADGWMSRSAHEFVLESLPPRFWKWRQAGSALFLAEHLPRGSAFDVMAVSGMIDLAHLKTLRPDLPPALLYVHENQFAYPLSPGELRDFRYGLTDLVNVLGADAVVFNSAYNRDSFFGGCRGLFERLPDAVPWKLVESVKEKIRIIPPGIDGEAIEEVSARQSADPSTTGGKRPATAEQPLVIWNHRHEHDKDPATTFRVLGRLAEKGVGFSLAVLGQRYSTEPAAFDEARRVLAARIVFDGYPPRREYLELLGRGAVAVSSALQENFGLSVVEAARSGCYPVLPRRLAYPEVLPEWAHGKCLWDDESSYEELLERVLTSGAEQRERVTRPLAESVARYDWSVVVTELDRALEEAANRRRQSAPVREVSWP